MKVIFIEDVPDVARSGEMKEVADGYARNYLLPRKLAVFASPATINAMAAKMEARIRANAQMEVEMRDVAETINGKEIFLEAKSGGKERLYGSITTADIAAELENATGVAIDKKKLKLAEPIHALGTYEVDIKLAKDIASKIRVTVTEKPSEEEKPPEKEKSSKSKKAAEKKEPAVTEEPSEEEKPAEEEEPAKAEVPVEVEEPAKAEVLVEVEEPAEEEPSEEEEQA